MRSTIVNKLRHTSTFAIFKGVSDTNDTNTIARAIHDDRKGSRRLAELIGARFNAAGTAIEKYDLLCPLLYPTQSPDDDAESPEWRIGKLFRNPALMKVIHPSIQSRFPCADFQWQIARCILFGPNSIEGKGRMSGGANGLKWGITSTTGSLIACSVTYVSAKCSRVSHKV